VGLVGDLFAPTTVRVPLAEALRIEGWRVNRMRTAASIAVGVGFTAFAIWANDITQKRDAVP
jgi:hypothetical protein